MKIVEFVTDEYDISLRLVHEWNRQAEWNIDQTSNPHITLWYIVSGIRILVLKGKQIMLTPGDFMVLPPHTSFQTIHQGSEVVPFHYFALGASIHVRFLEWTNLYGIPLITKLNLTNSLTLCQQWKELEKFWLQTNIPSHVYPVSPKPITRSMMPLLDASTSSELLKLSGLFRLWLGTVIDLLIPHMQTPSPIVDERVQTVCAIIRQRYADKLGINVLAGMINISEGHLRALFRYSMKTSIHQYQLNVRLNKAKELLASSKLSVFQIAQEVGFDNLSHFSQTFRKHESLSPIEFRGYCIPHGKPKFP